MIRATTILPSLAFAGLLSLSFTGPAPAQGISSTSAGRPAEFGKTFDNLKDRALNFPTHQVAPLSFSFDEGTLYALNQPGSRLVMFDSSSMNLIREIPIGHGAVSVHTRFAPRELWIVDQVANVVIVVDANQNEIAHTIPVGASPRGLAFTPAFDRAYVTCGAVDRVDVIDTATYQKVAGIPVPLNEPHAIQHLGNHVYVSSLRSGNNTAPMGVGPGRRSDEIVSIQDLALLAPQVATLPDCDVIAIATSGPQVDTVDPTFTATGVGTVLLNMHRRPGTQELWIPNTEALNAEHRGEKSFPQGQVVQNRVSIVDAQTGGVLQILDLDELAPPGVACGQPAGIGFTPDGSRAFVCSYGNDLVAVLDVAGGSVTWAGVVRIPITIPYPRGAGSRTALVDSQGQRLFVFNKQNNSVTRIPLAQLPTTSGFDWTAPTPAQVGFNPVTEDERNGRMHFIRAIDSASQRSSCASCHIDGTNDGVLWDLSTFLDPEGVPADAVHFGVDVKGPMVTQNTQRLFGTSPYHWRGERRRLKQFNKTFLSLFEHEENGQPSNLGPDFQYIIHYMQRLAYPPNPRQKRDRGLTKAQQRGAELFHTMRVMGDATCSTCHQLPLGTTGEIVSTGRGGFAPTAVIPSLRAVADKETPEFTIGGAFDTRTELGAGYLHDGARSSLVDAFTAVTPADEFEGHVFPMRLQDAAAIDAYLHAFDTGLAPAATMMVTANAGNAAEIAADELPLLLEQAERGWCDVVVRKGPTDFNGFTVHPSGVYDTDQDKFVFGSTTLPPEDAAQLIAQAQAGNPVTFLGTPVLMGVQMGIDRDLDELLDLDELVQGTDPEYYDTDLDGYPDGYEVSLAMDPLGADTSAPDSVAPSLAGEVELVYATTTALKFEFETDEPARIVVAYNGELPVLRLPLAQDYETKFSVTLFELKADTAYDIELDVYDPAGNRRFEYVSLRTPPNHFERGVFVRSVDPTIQVGSVSGGPSAPRRLQVEVELRRADGFPDPGYEVFLDVYHERSDGVLQEVATGLRGLLTRTDGILHVSTPLPGLNVLGGPGTLHVIPRDVVPPSPSAPLYVPSLDKEDAGTVAY